MQLDPPRIFSIGCQECHHKYLLFSTWAKESRHPTIKKVEAWKRWPAQTDLWQTDLWHVQHFLVGFLNCDPLHEQDGEWGFTRAQQGFFEDFRIPRKVYILKDGMRGGCLLHQRMILWWSCFFYVKQKTWVEKKKHAAFGEGFLVTANWVEAFFLPPYTSQMEFNWSAYTSPVSKLSGVRCCVAMHFFLRKAKIMSSESGCRW